MDKQKIGNFIRERRKEKDLTQQELAEKIGISDRAVSKWERGICCPDISILKDLCKILDININELLSGGEIKETNKDESADILVETVKNYTDVYIKKNRALLTFTIIILALYVFLVIAMYLTFNQVNKKDGINWEIIETKKIAEKIFKALERYDYEEIRNIEMKYTDADIKDIYIYDDETKCMESLEKDNISSWAFACRLKDFENNGIKFKSHRFESHSYDSLGSYSARYKVVVSYNNIDIYMYVYLSTHNGVINYISGTFPFPNDKGIFELKEEGYENINNKIGYFFNVIYGDHYMETIE